MSSPTILHANGHASSAALPSSLAWRVGGAGPSADEIARVEAAVRAVLASLLQGSPRPVGASPRPPCFAGPLLAERHVDPLQHGTTELCIEPGTVVTPLARERLKRRGIILRLVSRSELVRAGAVAEWGLALESGGDLLRRALLAGPEPWADLGADPAVAAAWIGQTPARAGVIITDTAALACYRASQTSGVRAAVAADAEAVRIALATLDANCLVVERPALSIHAIRHLCASFRRFAGAGSAEARS